MNNEQRLIIAVRLLIIGAFVIFLLLAGATIGNAA